MPVQTNLSDVLKNDKVSGGEYISKVNLCFSKIEPEMRFSRAKLSDSAPPRDFMLVEADDVPSCIVGPLQIIALHLDD
jgi:hypothetical protein